MQADGSTQGRCHSLDRTSIEKCNNTLVVVLETAENLKKCIISGNLLKSYFLFDFDDFGICRKVQHFE